MLPTGTKSSVYFISAAHLCFPARGCGEHVPWRDKNSLSVLPGRRDFGYDAGRRFIYGSRFEHYRTWLACFFAFRFSYDVRGIAVYRILHKECERWQTYGTVRRKVKLEISFVQQIEFSSKKIYNWMKKNAIGRKEIT